MADASSPSNRSAGENSEVLISVSDTGVGLPPQQADQFFKAFFTTKPHGTGMGLSISRSIVKRTAAACGPDDTPCGAIFQFTCSCRDRRPQQSPPPRPHDVPLRLHAPPLTTIVPHYAATATLWLDFELVMDNPGGIRKAFTSSSKFCLVTKKLLPEILLVPKRMRSIPLYEDAIRDRPLEAVKPLDVSSCYGRANVYELPNTTLDGLKSR